MMKIEKQPGTGIINKDPKNGVIKRSGDSIVTKEPGFGFIKDPKEI